MIDMSELAIELTLLTGEVVTSEKTDYWYNYLIFPDGRLGTNEKKRFEITAIRPEGCAHRVDGPKSITVDPSRPLPDIARDIARRIIPDARAYWQKSKEAEEEHNEEVRKTCELVDEFAALGLRSGGYYNDRYDQGARLYGKQVEIEVYSGQRIYYLKISEPTKEQTIKIIKLLQELTP